MKPKKAVLDSICILLLSFSLFAENGLMAGQKNIKCLATKWFDIIYPESSEQSAAELVTQADKIYEDICSGLGITPQFRMPVVITTSTEVFNAYFTNYTFDHIVLYDAVPEEDMAVFPDTIVNTFKHELTHAVTLNLRNGLKSVGNVLGEILNWGDYVCMPSMVKEGASVAYESKEGNGRLNDEYYLQFVKQAKIENKFPSWADVTGAMDRYPSGNSAYAFGGPFTEWLQKTYGMDKYIAFWNYAVNMKAVTFVGAFKKAYGIKLDTVWAQFITSIEVPPVDANPLSVDGVDDFFSFGSQQTQLSGVREFSTENNRGSLYESLTESDKGIAYIDANTVWYAEKNDEDGTFKQPKKLFSKVYLSRISLSNDGRFLAVSCYNINHLTVKNEVSVYDMQTGRWLNVDGVGLRDATIVCCDDASGEKNYYLAAVKTQSQNVSLVVYKIALNTKKSITGIFLNRTMAFPRGDIAYSLCDGGHGDVVCIYKSQMTWTIKLFEAFCNTDADKLLEGTVVVKTYVLPKDGMRIRNIARIASDGERDTFAFSWTAAGTMPRLGYLEVGGSQDELFSLMRPDISGGVYNPVAYRCADSNRGQLPSVAYVGCFLGDRKLLVMNSAKIDFEEANALATVETHNTKPQQSTFDRSVLADAKTFKTLYWNKGTPLPYSSVTQYSRFLNEMTSFMFPGLTWVTSNPWDSDYFAVSGGYDVFSDTGGVVVDFSGKSDTSLFSYSFQQTATFDSLGFKQSVSRGAVNSGFMVDNVSSVVFSDVALLMIGRQQMYTYWSLLFLDNLQSFSSLRGCLGTSDPNVYFSALNQVGVSYSNVHRSGPGAYEKLGFTASVYYQDVYAGGQLGDWSPDYFYQGIFPELTIRLPKLIPVNCVSERTYNFPVAVKASLVSSSTSLLSGSVQTVVFAQEIQKGLKFIPVFVNRFTTTFGYNIEIEHQNDTFEFIRIIDDFKNPDKLNIVQALEVKAVFDITGNTGALASSGVIGRIGMSYDFYLSGAMTGEGLLGFAYSLLF